MSKYLKALVASCCISWAVVTSVAWADDADLLLDVLQQQRSMQAEFTQSITDTLGREIQASRGSLKIQKPKQFLWRTSEPFEQEIISDGEKMWVFDVDLDQLTIQPVDQQWDSTPALLLTGDEDEVRKNFVIQLVSKDAQSLIFNVSPVATDSAYKSLELVLENKKVVGMRFTDHLGQISSIQFTEIVTDKPIAKSEFIIEPSAEVDVIDYFKDAEFEGDGLDDLNSHLKTDSETARFTDSVSP
ncbi:MAG: outer membrane lipoprotein carrier protein LolA [Gammaproteobacteria bacterium]|nr:MAG: outer membrane lipoprotein carrier protein LolA [Gammaproteobacteria bacterium]